MELVSKMNVGRGFSIDSWLKSKGYSVNFDYIRYAEQPTDIYTLFISKWLRPGNVYYICTGCRPLYL